MHKILLRAKFVPKAISTLLAVVFLWSTSDAMPQRDSYTPDVIVTSKILPVARSTTHLLQDSYLINQKMATPVI